MMFNLIPDIIFDRLCRLNLRGINGFKARKELILISIMKDRPDVKVADIFDVYDCVDLTTFCIDANRLTSQQFQMLLSYAAFKGALELCDLIFSTQQVHINQVNTALFSVSALSKLVSVKYFVERGADVEFVCQGSTALLSSFNPIRQDQVFDTTVSEYLVSKGANLNRIFTRGENYLHRTSRADYPNKLLVYQRLFDFGIDSSVTNDKNETALDILFSVTTVPAVLDRYSALTAAGRQTREREIVTALIDHQKSLLS